MENNELKVFRNLDAETPLSIRDDVLRVDWRNIGEGHSGDYNHNDPEDENLLRFDVYVKTEFYPEYHDSDEDAWEVVEDASYCTCMLADTDVKILEEALLCIFRRYRDVIDSPDDYPSVKKLGEELSWISPETFEKKEDS